MALELHNTENPIANAERLKINENWQRIIAGYNHLEWQIKILTGKEDVGELIKRLEDALNDSEATLEDLQLALSEAQQSIADMIEATTNANDAAMAANQATNTAVQIIADLTLLQDELEQLQMSLEQIITDATQAITDADTAATNANQAAQDAQQATTNADNAANRANNAADAIEGWGQAVPYQNGTTYNRNNPVTYQGSTYQSLVNNNDSLPTDSTKWIVLAQRGLDGQGAVSSVEGELPDPNGDVKLPMMAKKDEVQVALDGKANSADLTSLEDVVTTHLDNSNKQIKLLGNRFVRALGNRLSMGIEDTCISLVGDSTGNAENEWFYMSMNWLASKYPKYKVQYLLWNDTTQSYYPPVDWQNGIGTVNGVNLNGGFISTPHKASHNITTNSIEIKVKVNHQTWTSSVAQTLISKFGAAGNRSWAFAVGNTGIPYIWVSSDGTANTIHSATTDIKHLAGQDIWLRVIIENSGGNTVSNFYTGTDGTTWNQLGSPVVVSGTSNIYNANYPIEIGVRAGNSEPFTGTFYEGTVMDRNAIKMIANPRIISNDTTFSDSYSNTWTYNGNYSFKLETPTLTILNGSQPGANIAYSLDNTRFDKQFIMEPQLAFISYSHNEGDAIYYTTPYQELCDKILTKYPFAGIVCVTQNPQSTKEVNAKYHAIRNRRVVSLAATRNYGIVDVFRTFIETGNFENYISSDGVHPTQDGNDLWRDEVIQFLLPATL